MSVGYSTPGQPAIGETYTFASTWRRFFAWLLDAILILVIAFVIGALLGVVEQTTSTSTGSNGSTVTTTFYSLKNGWANILFGAVSGVYFVGLWLLSGRSLAQRLFGLRVARAERPAGIDFSQAVLRWLLVTGWYLPVGIAQTLAPDSSVWALISLVGFGWMVVLLVSTAIDERHQGIQDQVAGTVVVRRLVVQMVQPAYAQPPYVPPPAQEPPAPQTPAVPPQPAEPHTTPPDRGQGS